MLKRWRIAPLEWLVIAVLIVVSAQIFSDLVWHVIYGMPGSDYNGHIEFATKIVQQFEFERAHILFELLIIALSRIFSITMQEATWFIAVFFYVVTALILYAMLRGALGASRWWKWLIAAVGALALLLVTPIILLTTSTHNLYFGYIGINVAHNPAMVLLKPFALLLFVFALAILQHRRHLSVSLVIAGVVLVLLSLLAKPNYALALLPALLIVIAYRLIRRDTADLVALAAALVVPMIVLLGVQYLLMYVSIDQGTGGIVFAPLLVVLHYDPSVESVVVKFFLSILFPLVLYVLYARKAVRDLPLNLGWLIFLAGFGQMYFLAEAGLRQGDANFYWSGQIGLFVLFVASTLFWLRHAGDRPRWRALVCLAIFALHLYSGYVFYNSQMQSGGMFDWW